jgi:hypothetical protein
MFCNLFGDVLSNVHVRFGHSERATITGDISNKRFLNRSFSFFVVAHHTGVSLINIFYIIFLTIILLRLISMMISPHIGDIDVFFIGLK